MSSSDETSTYPEIVEIIAGEDPRFMAVDLVRVLSAGQEGLHIGKNSKSAFQIGTEAPPRIRNTISQVQATIYRDENGDICVRDGNGRPSSNGIYVSQKYCYKPVKLCGSDLKPTQAIHIDLVFPRKGYRCFLEWAPIRNENTDSHPTVNFDNEVLKGEIDAREEQIADLRLSIQTLESRVGFQDKQIDHQKTVNEKQDAALARHKSTLRRVKKLLLIIGAVVAVGSVMLLGMDAGTVKSIAEVVLALFGATGVIGAIKD